MTGQPTPRRDYLISITTKDATERVQIRNAMCRLGAREIWPGFYWATLTEHERANLARKFGKLRIRRG